MSIAERLEGKRVVICAGSGGVGKTTTSAALAMGLAAAGQKVAVVTIDPAKRLADSLGLEDLDNEPRLVDAVALRRHGIEMQGELWAMMLDAKRTFDELITRLAPDDKTRDEVLANRIYKELSGAVAGSQEFTRSPSSTSSTARATSTSSSSTRRRRATRWTSSTRPTG
jgi:anion-transporting  ArsA/GET3 family ATPase